MKGARFLMLTKMTKLFVLFISKQTKLFSYIRQAYDPCLRHGDELCSLHSCSTGSPACQGLRPRTPGCLIIAAWFSFYIHGAFILALNPCLCLNAYVDSMSIFISRPC